MSCSRMKHKLDQGDERFVLIDARHEDAYQEGRIPGARFIDVDQPVADWDLGSKEKVYVFYCYSELCHRAAWACLNAALDGYRVMELHGGFEGWEGYPMPVEK